MGSYSPTKAQRPRYLKKALEPERLLKGYRVASDGGVRALATE